LSHCRDNAIFTRQLEKNSSLQLRKCSVSCSQAYSYSIGEINDNHVMIANKKSFSPFYQYNFSAVVFIRSKRCDIPKSMLCFRVCVETVEDDFNLVSEIQPCCSLMDWVKDRDRSFSFFSINDCCHFQVRILNYSSIALEGKWFLSWMSRLSL
jgi:hypothetical protein